MQFTIAIVALFAATGLAAPYNKRAPALEDVTGSANSFIQQKQSDGCGVLGKSLPLHSPHSNIPSNKYFRLCHRPGSFFCHLRRGRS